MNGIVAHGRAPAFGMLSGLLVGTRDGGIVGQALRKLRAHAQGALQEVRPAGCCHHPSKYAKISGATMVASLSTINFGVSVPSLPQVIFSLGTAPE